MKELKFNHIAEVGIGQFVIAEGVYTLVAYGIGSSICTIFYSELPEKKVGGMVHAILPNEEYSLDRRNRIKFTDLAIRDMLEKFLEMGVNKDKIKARIIGGAHIYCNSCKSIAEENISSSKRVLDELGISIVSEDVGGDRGRSIFFEIGSGKVWVRTSNLLNGKLRWIIKEL